MSSPAQVVITPEALLEHWQGHRRVTRRIIDAFPEDKLFSFSVGGMRPFSELSMEFLKMSVPTLKGIIAKDWSSEGPRRPRPRPSCSSSGMRIRRRSTGSGRRSLRPAGRRPM